MSLVSTSQYTEFEPHRQASVHSERTIWPRNSKRVRFNGVSRGFRGSNLVIQSLLLSIQEICAIFLVWLRSSSLKNSTNTVGLFRACCIPLINTPTRYTEP